MTKQITIHKFQEDLERLFAQQFFYPGEEYICLCRETVLQNSQDALDIILAMSARKSDQAYRETLDHLFKTACDLEQVSMLERLLPRMDRPLRERFIMNAAEEQKQQTLNTLLPHYSKKALLEALKLCVYDPEPDKHVFDFFYKATDEEDRFAFSEELQDLISSGRMKNQDVGVTMFLKQARIEHDQVVLQDLTAKIIEKREETAGLELPKKLVRKMRSARPGGS